MDLSLDFVTDYLVVTVLVACLITGYVLKKWIKDVDNKYIPTIMAIEGAILNCILCGGVGVEIIIAGAMSGLASTGLHQAFKQIIENSKGNTTVEETEENEQ